MHTIKRTPKPRLPCTRLATASALAPAVRSVSRVGSSSARSSHLTGAAAVRAGRHDWTRGLATFASPPPTAATSSASPASRKPLFTKILIANRGEIAIRIMRTAKSLGIKTVAVFSTADRHAMHVKFADEAYCVGPAPSAESYLNVDAIIDVCRRTGAQAVHPGYGFLSENAGFAKRLEQEGIVFIGPPASAIVSMGSKAESKDIMLAANVPCVPGFHPSTVPGAESSSDHQSPEFLLEEAKKIGFPVLIKAVSGGGGKGMKIVDREEDFRGQLESAKRESKKSFGDDEVLLEKYLTTPRHIEVQIFSSPRETVSLSTRDCSVQRRHQKILEEAPAPGLDPELRERLEATARRAAKAVGYVGAGTVEFIVDAVDPNQYYFMEMNTRLQVEHCVTEAVTNVDLVQWQLEVASGNELPKTQEEIDARVTGHAFEARIYAESPRNNFLPDTGLLQHVQLPVASERVRIETGFTTGDEISVFYDPLIAKLIVSGPTRLEALHAMHEALKSYQVVGPSTNLAFLRRLTAHPAFMNGELETGFIEKHRASLFEPEIAPDAEDLAQVGLYLASKVITDRAKAGRGSPWTDARLAGFRVGPRSGGALVVDLEQRAAGEPQEAAPSTARVSVKPAGMYAGKASFSAEVVGFDGQTSTLTELEPDLSAAGSTTTLISASLQSVSILPQAATSTSGEKLHLFSSVKGLDATVSRPLPAWLRGGAASAKSGGAGVARAPMPSRVVQVMVSEGQEVKQGEPLVMVEAMKTEHVLRAGRDGVVKRVGGAVGELVPQGHVLVEFEEVEGTEA